MSLDDLTDLCPEKDTSYVQFCMITMNIMVMACANGLCSIQSIALDCIPLLSITILTYTYLWELTAQWQTAKKQLTNNTEHVTQNNTLGPGPRGV